MFELKVEHPKKADAKDVLEEISGMELIVHLRVLNWFPFLDKGISPN